MIFYPNDITTADRTERFCEYCKEYYIVKNTWTAKRIDWLYCPACIIIIKELQEKEHAQMIANETKYNIEREAKRRKEIPVMVKEQDNCVWCGRDSERLCECRDKR